MRVVHCKKEPYTHYIGRPSPLGNRYSHRPSKVPGTIMVGTVEEALVGFEDDVITNPDLKAAIMALPEDAVLGCWCKPKDCHGDIIVRLWYEFQSLSTSG